MEKLPVWIGPFGDQPVDLYAKGGTYLPTSLDKVYWIGFKLQETHNSVR